MKLHMSFPTDVKVMLLLVFLYGMTWLIVTWFRRRSAVTWMQNLSERLDMREWDAEFSGYLKSATPCPYCHELFYGEGDPIRKHVDYCDYNQENSQ